MQIMSFYVPVAHEEEAITLGRNCVEQHLAACANFLPIQSIYIWDDQLRQDGEYALILKTTIEGSAALQDFIEQNHSYDVPCIIQKVVDVNEAYGAWVSTQVYRPL